MLSYLSYLVFIFIADLPEARVLKTSGKKRPLIANSTYVDHIIG